MSTPIDTMLQKYVCTSSDDYVSALREIMQELALLGLWRANFFEHAAFYGGTALRILYGLDRASEDLDFSLLKPGGTFNFDTYGDALKNELENYGFKVSFSVKEKTSESHIESAFLKTNTQTQLIHIGVAPGITRKINARSELKIKLEIDVEPPAGFSTEIRYLYSPTPYSVRSYTLSSSLSGKLHAILCRRWAHRVKGRDWYDMLWYAGKGTNVDLYHLEMRMRQSAHYNAPEPLTLVLLRAMLHDAVDAVDLAQLKDDVRPFIAHQSSLDAWSKDLFHACVDVITA